MDAYGYVRFIVTNFNSIRQGAEDSVLLVVDTNSKQSHIAAMCLMFDAEKGYWQIKTAQPRETDAVRRKKKLWQVT